MTQRATVAKALFTKGKKFRGLWTHSYERRALMEAEILECDVEAGKLAIAIVDTTEPSAVHTYLGSVSAESERGTLLGTLPKDGKLRGTSSCPLRPMDAACNAQATLSPVGMRLAFETGSEGKVELKEWAPAE